jgi:hypothetical protein
MSAPSRSKKRWLFGAGVLAALALGGAIYLYAGRPGGAPEGPKRNHPPGFREMAAEAGITFRMCFLPNEQGANFKINLYDHGCGVAVGDYDGDGHDDIYFTNQLGPNALYRNRGDGTFEEVAEKAGVALGDRICVGATFADTRNNGRQDLFVTSTRGGNVFFRNQGDGTFKDATREAGLTYVGHSQTAVFFDFDNDGHLDLLVTNTGRWTTNGFDTRQKYYPGKNFAEGFNNPKEPNILYRNRGDGTFENVTAKAGFKDRGWSGDVAVFDYNGDGYLDLLVTNMFGPSTLYRNNGDGTFTDVTRKVLGPTSFGSIGAKAFDFNNDGKLDLLLVDMHSDMWMDVDYSHASLELAREGEKKKYPHLAGPRPDQTPAAKEEYDHQVAAEHGYRTEDVVYGNTFFKNLGGGRFVEMSDRAGLENFWPWGIAAGDFDNDGYQDLFVPAGMGYPFYYWPNYLLMNNRDETFTNRAEEEGIEPPARGQDLPEEIAGRPACRSSRCAAVADFDGDGRLDIIVNNFNDTPYYFKNNFPRKNWIAICLTGTSYRRPGRKWKTSRDAIGALVTLHLGKKDGKEEIMVRQVNPAGGYLSQSSKVIHFGLGDRPRVGRVEIRWPSGIRQVIKDPPINPRSPIPVTEPAK